MSGWDCEWQLLKRIMQTKLLETPELTSKELEIYINENNLYSKKISYEQLAHILGRAVITNGRAKMFKKDNAKWRLNK